MPTTTCPLCFHQVATDADGRFARHEHTPAIDERCGGSGNTPDEAKRIAAEVVAKMREIRKANEP